MWCDVNMQCKFAFTYKCSQDCYQKMLSKPIDIISSLNCGVHTKGTINLCGKVFDCYIHSQLLSFAFWLRLIVGQIRQYLTENANYSADHRRYWLRYCYYSILIHKLLTIPQTTTAHISDQLQEFIWHYTHITLYRRYKVG